MSKYEHVCLVDIDHFPCGCIVTTPERKILFANAFLNEVLGWESQDLIDRCLDSLLTRASQLFCDSYILPTVLKDGQCQEILIEVLTADRQRVPKTLSVRRMPNGNLVWVFMQAETRQKLFRELKSAQTALEEQRAELDELARTDQLTQLANRRQLEEAAERIFHEADRTKAAVSLMIMDIDKFKSINDTYGHMIGDQALVALSNVLTDCLRKSDIIARFGGDEFVCLLNHTSVEQAEVTARKIHDGIASQKTVDCEFTVSIGISQRDKVNPMSFEEMIALADQALYKAKATGRNKTVSR